MAKEETPGTDVAVIDVQGEVELLAGMREMETVDTAALTEAQLWRILGAETEAEAFGETATYSAEDLIDVPFEVSQTALAPSQFHQGKGAYVIADIVRMDTGERCLLTTSAARPAARLRWLTIHGKLPRKCVVTVLKEVTASGYRVLGFELIG